MYYVIGKADKHVSDTQTLDYCMHKLKAGSLRRLSREASYRKTRAPASIATYSYVGHNTTNSTTSTSLGFIFRRYAYSQERGTILTRKFPSPEQYQAYSLETTGVAEGLTGGLYTCYALHDYFPPQPFAILGSNPYAGRKALV